VYCGRVEAGTGGELGGTEVGALVSVWVGRTVGVLVAVSVGRGVMLGSRVSVGRGVKLSATGWKGVGVALAFGSTVTRLKGGEEAEGVAPGTVQEASNIRQNRMPGIRKVQNWNGREGFSHPKRLKSLLR